MLMSTIFMLAPMSTHRMTTEGVAVGPPETTPRTCGNLHRCPGLYRSCDCSWQPPSIRGSHHNIALRIGMPSWTGSIGLALMGATLALGGAGTASAQTDFYACKQLSLIIGSSTGGGYDVISRLLARHFGRLIPGNPTIVSQNMPAAASL